MVASPLNPPGDTGQSTAPVGFLDVPGAARFLSVSKALLDKLRCTGGGPKFCKAGRVIRYHVDDLTAWMRERCYASNAEAYAAETAVSR